MNPEAPKLRVETPKPKNLTQILERRPNGKPILNLTRMEGKAINTPTKRSYNQLMRVYECGGWMWPGGTLPTEDYSWDTFEEKTFITLGDKSKNFMYGSNTDNYPNRMTTEEFYAAQDPPISQAWLDEINEWFNSRIIK